LELIIAIEQTLAEKGLSKEDLDTTAEPCTEILLSTGEVLPYTEASQRWPTPDVMPEDAKVRFSQKLKDGVVPRPQALAQPPPVKAVARSPDDYDSLCKMILIGDAAVGKTHLLSRYIKGTLPKAPQATIGVEFATRQIPLPCGCIIKAQMWDTGGQERYRAITAAHFRRTACACLVYDVTKMSSFQNCGTWLEKLRSTSPDVVVMLVGNKAERDEDRVVEYNAAAEFARQEGLLFAEASAVTGFNVQHIFEHLLQEAHNQSQGPRRILQLQIASCPNDNDESEVDCADMTGSKLTSMLVNLRLTTVADLFQKVATQLSMKLCNFEVVVGDRICLSKEDSSMTLDKLLTC